MKTTTTTIGNALFFLILFSASFASAATYTTLRAGAWNNTTTVWSTNGSTPCGCTPGPIMNNHEVNVYHALTLPYDLTVRNGTKLFVDGWRGSLSGSTRTLNLENGGEINAFGNITLTKVFQTGGVFNLSFATLSLGTKYDIQGGTLNVYSGYVFMNSNFTIMPGATVNLYGGYLETSGGSIENNGVFYIGLGSCARSSGTWLNTILGVVSGSGSAVSTSGNMHNVGTWSSLISWCAPGGNPVGMTSPINCAASGANCNGIVLSVELIDFHAELSSDNSILVSWSTASENNSDYFKVMKYNDDNHWVEIGEVDAAGNSTTTLNYRFEDKEANAGMEYYRLIQVDFDGSKYYSEIINLEIIRSGSEITLFPNPKKNSEILSIYNLSKGLTTVRVIGTNGKVIMTEIFEPKNGEVHLNTNDMNGGIYFVNIVQGGESITKKLVVAD